MVMKVSVLKRRTDLLFVFSLFISSSIFLIPHIAATSALSGDINNATLTKVTPTSEKKVVTLDGTSSTDLDGTIASYLWEQTAGPATKLSDIHSAKPTFVTPQTTSDTTLTFRLTVTDDEGASTSTNANVMIKSVNGGSVDKSLTSREVTNNLSLPNSPNSLSPDRALTSGAPDQNGTSLYSLKSSGNSAQSPILHPHLQNSTASSPTSSRASVGAAQPPAVADPSNVDISTGDRGESNNISGTTILNSDIAGTDKRRTGMVNDINEESPATSATNNIDSPLELQQLQSQVVQPQSPMTTATPSTGNIDPNFWGLPQPQPQQLQQSLQLPFYPFSLYQQNHLPITDSPAQYLTADENSYITLDGASSYNPNTGGSIISYQWTQLSMGVPVALIGANTATASFVAPQVEHDSLLGFNLIVTDNIGVTNPTPFTFYVLVRNSGDSLSLPFQPPTIAASPSVSNNDPDLQGLQEQQQLLQLHQQPQYQLYPKLP
jgi:hypothetical protein